jgi:hypothetical protein
LASEKLSTFLLFLPPNELAFQPDFRVSAALLRTDLPVSLLEQYFIAGDEYRVTYDSQANKLRQVQATALTVLLRLLQQAAQLRDPADEQPLPVRAQYLVTVMNDNASQVFQKPDFWERLVANNAELLMTDDALLLEVVLQSCEPAKQPDLVHQCVSIIGRESYDDSAYVKTEAQKQVLEHTLRSLGPSVLEYVWQNYGLMPRREDEDPGAEREPKRARYSFNIPEDAAMMLITCAVSVFPDLQTTELGQSFIAYLNNVDLDSRCEGLLQTLGVVFESAHSQEGRSTVSSPPAAMDEDDTEDNPPDVTVLS